MWELTVKCHGMHDEQVTCNTWDISEGFLKCYVGNSHWIMFNTMEVISFSVIKVKALLSEDLMEEPTL